MIKVVFDTVIFVRGLINPHSFCSWFFLKYSSRFRLFVSSPIVKEILEVIDRPEIAKKYKTNTVDKQKILAVLSQAENIKISKVEEICRDEKDDVFLATAWAAKVDYLVSEDKDLLVLRKYKGVKIIDGLSF